jgi:hypothetical protein
MHTPNRSIDLHPTAAYFAPNNRIHAPNGSSLGLAIQRAQVIQFWVSGKLWLLLKVVALYQLPQVLGEFSQWLD